MADALRDKFLGPVPDDDMSWLLKRAEELALALEPWAHWDVQEFGKQCMDECEAARQALLNYRERNTR